MENNSIQSSGTLVKLTYFLYIISLIFGGVTIFVALFVNIFGRDNANKVEISHYKHQMSLFLKSLVLFVIGLITLPIFIGFIILLATYFWLLYKSIQGLDLISRGLPINEYYEKD